MICILGSLTIFEFLVVRCIQQPDGNVHFCKPQICWKVSDVETFTFIFWQRCVRDLARFRAHKQTTGFGFGSVNFFGQNASGNYPEISLKLSSSFALTNVETQSQTAVTGLAEACRNIQTLSTLSLCVCGMETCRKLPVARDLLSFINACKTTQQFNAKLCTLALEWQSGDHKNN